MVDAAEHLAEGTLTNLLLHFKSVRDVVSDVAQVLTLFVVEAAILKPVRRAERLTRRSFCNVDKVDRVVV